MKYISTLLALATVAMAVAYSVSIIVETVPKIHALRASVRACIADIIAVAKLENPIVGDRIETKFAVQAKKARDLIELSTNNLSKLQSEGVKGLRPYFHKILSDTKKSLVPELKELSDETQRKVHNIFKTSIADWKNHTAGIYAAFGVDYYTLPTIESSICGDETEVTVNGLGKGYDGLEQIGDVGYGC